MRGLAPVFETPDPSRGFGSDPSIGSGPGLASGWFFNLSAFRSEVRDPRISRSEPTDRPGIFAQPHGRPGRETPTEEGLGFRGEGFAEGFGSCGAGGAAGGQIGPREVERSLHVRTPVCGTYGMAVKNLSWGVRRRSRTRSVEIGASRQTEDGPGNQERLNSLIAHPIRTTMGS